jgi:hypothetical protein
MLPQCKYKSKNLTLIVCCCCYGRWYGRLNREKTGGTKVGAQSQQRQPSLEAEILTTEIPSKLIATPMKVQITCGIREVNMSGKIDMKGIRTIVNKMNPVRVVILRGSPEQSNALKEQILASQATSMKTFVSIPRDGEAVTFLAGGDRIKLQVQSDFVVHDMAVVRGATSMEASGQGSESSGSNASSVVVQVVPVMGQVSELAASDIIAPGTRVVPLQPPAAAPAASASDSCVDLIADAGPITAALYPYSLQATTFIEEHQPGVASTARGAVSIGEVMLSSLKQKLEQRGVAVEFRLGTGAATGGGVLICGGQVVVRKDNENDFVLEGPPIPAYFLVRKVLYEYFAFI